MADNLNEINCPACGEKMVKIFIPSKGFNLDVCLNGCGGIYFDNREFKHFDEPHEDISPLIKVLKDKEFKKVNENVTRKCPVCGSDMVKNFSSVKREIQIDECYSCGGKFLDYEELDKIRSEYSTEKERADAVVKQLYADVGIENFLPLNLKQKNWKKGALDGAMVGVIIAFIVVNINKTTFTSLPYYVSMSFALCICVLSAIFGALLKRKA